MITHIKELRGSHKYISDIQAIYGSYNTYLFTATRLEQKNMIGLHFSVEYSSELKDAISELRKQYNAIALGGVYNEDNQLTVELNMVNLANVSEFDQILAAIVDVFQTMNVRQMNQETGDTGDIGIYRIGTKLRFLSSDGFESETETIKQQYSNKNGNIVLSWLLAICGMLIGVGIWIAIGRIGFVAGIAGYFMLKFGIKGFEKGGSVLTKNRVYIMLGLNAVAVVVAYILDMTLRIYWSPSYFLSFWNAVTITLRYITSQAGIFSFLTQFAIGIGLSIWSSWSLIQYLLNYAPNHESTVRRKNNRLL